MRTIPYSTEWLYRSAEVWADRYVAMRRHGDYGSLGYVSEGEYHKFMREALEMTMDYLRRAEVGT